MSAHAYKFYSLSVDYIIAVVQDLIHWGWIDIEHICTIKLNSVLVWTTYADSCSVTYAYSHEICNWTCKNQPYMHILYFENTILKY